RSSMGASMPRQARRNATGAVPFAAFPGGLRAAPLNVPARHDSPAGAAARHRLLRMAHARAGREAAFGSLPQNVWSWRKDIAALGARSVTERRELTSIEEQKIAQLSSGCHYSASNCQIGRPV